jgi:hypothetical protein
MSRLVLLTTLALIAVTGALAEEWNRTFQTSGQPELRVDTDDANVTVRAADVNRIEARVTTEGWKIGPGEVEVQDRQIGDGVELIVRRPRFRNTGFRNQWVRIEVQVPRNARTDLRTGDGNIVLTGVQADARLNTGDGNIIADGFAGSMEARTGDGNVRVQGRFDGLVVHTGDGNVEGNADAGSKLAASWRVETGDGNVRLRLPADIAADVELRTGDGRISVDYPMLVSAGRLNESNVRAKLNGGGLPLYVRTGDGSISLTSN